MTLAFYMTASAFWWTFAFIFISMIICIIDAAHSEGENGISHVSGIFLLVWLIVMSIFRFGPSKDTQWKSEVIESFNGGDHIEERVYHSVEFIGKRAAVMNPSDMRWYVDMRNGAMVSYNRIMNEGMCRMCDQFDKGAQGDTIYIYRVQKDAPHFWNSGPVYFFSKHQDLVLQGSQSMEVIVKP